MPLSVFIVWEPILPTDIAGVKTAALSRIPDSRAVQFWDKEHILSQRMGGPAGFGPKTGSKIFFDMDDVIWDFVAIYMPGFRWKDSGQSPAFAGAPVVKVLDDIRSQLKLVKR